MPIKFIRFRQTASQTIDSLSIHIDSMVMDSETDPVKIQSLAMNRSCLIKK